MSLTRFGVTRPVPVNILMAAFLAGGVATGMTLTKEFFPETTSESATVTLPYPGATPREIEDDLARKVEDKLANLDEVEKMTTAIVEGRGRILVEFRDGIDDAGEATDEVERAIDTLTDLPEESERIVVAEFQPTLPVIMVVLFGEADEEALKRAVRQIRDDLDSLPGMGEIILTGVRDYEIRVDVASAALLEHRLSLPQVSDVIRAWMTELPGGTVRTDVGNVNVRTMGVAERAEAIRQIVVKATPDGQVIRVADIADVRESFVDEQIKTRFRTRDLDGPSASLTVYKVGDQDAVEIAQMVRAYARGRRYAAGDGEAVFEARAADRVLGALNAMRETPMAARMRRVTSWLTGQPSSAGRTPAPWRTKHGEAYELGATSTVPLPAGCSLETASDLARFIEGRLDLLV
ncbi:MAG: efflux RND transporter permease subunit, partial [Planctomycetota bacterium]